MKLGLHLGQSGARVHDPADLALDAERYGFDCVWTAESYGADAISMCAWIGARTTQIGIGTAAAQIPARTPAATAMTALTLDHLSRGRFHLGLGVSSPAVSENWHGVAFERPLTRTREYVAIVREILRRERGLEYRGDAFTLPLTADGRPIKSILHPFRPMVPIYLAAIGPKTIELAAEIADGWIPAFYAPAHEVIFAEAVSDGLKKAGRSPSDLEIMPLVIVNMGNDLGACRAVVKDAIALYIGGMGSSDRNFYADLVTRYGYEGEVAEIRARYRAGRRDEAARAVPDSLVDDVALVGPRERIAERLELWRASAADGIIASTSQDEALLTLAELLL